MNAILLAVTLLFGLGDGSLAKDGAKPAAKPDSVIEAAIRARFERSRIGANKFQVRVQNGVATLTGKTDVVQHKGVATRLAKLGGAVQVRNQITVSERARAQAAARLAEAQERHTRKEATPSPAAKQPQAVENHKPARVAQDQTMSGAQPPPPRPRRAMIKK
jgi:hypothetical protein